MKRHIFLKGALTGALIVLLAAGLASCGLLKSEESRKMELLESLIDRYYIGEADAEDLTEGVYKGYIEGLGDPYSAYYDEEETARMAESLSGEFGGVGALMSQDRETGVITVLQVYEDSPAQKAGMQDGDVLYKVDGEDVSGRELTEVVNLVKGEKGTDVTLTLLRGDAGDEIELTVTRDTIEDQTVTYEMKEAGVGYIRVAEFDTVTYEQYKEALEDLEAQGMEKLVIDLRSNPGGNLETVCDMLDLMLPEGLIVYTEDKDGRREEYTSDAEHQFDKPLAVLVDGYSASASEIFAGAIQDYGLGQIVGTRSYGKGVVQSIFDLKDGTSVKLTIAEYFTPRGRSIDGEGITPDVEVEYVYDEADPQADNQLEKALEVLTQQ
ncbi:S41 family peptidase [Mordavella massiliensis]|uniref:S41 family peptidase n=1 Tax=Mordavella massiliensis TaxID=1871024 RepID=A0A938XBD7_9CLOT|nr:S41 family peptidase [Mordavella massiliensis]MBM6948930.1 S41 family peptidase [Mordavella massiliensis]